MSTKAGALLWNRMNISVLGGPSTLNVDTGLRQVNQNFDSTGSTGEPSMGTPGVAAPAPGTLPASRIQVIPLAPTAGWSGITHSEPWVSTVTGTVFVTFANTNEAGVDLNVLFWDPSTLVGPGQAEPYNPEA